MHSIVFVFCFIVFQNSIVLSFPNSKGFQNLKNSAVRFDLSFESDESIKFSEASSSRIRFQPDSDPQSISKGCSRTENVNNISRYDRKAKKCSQIGVKSHCGQNMIFYSYNNSKTYGQCDCDYNSLVPLIYHYKTDRCYFIYQQAYCKENEWLEMNPNNGKAFCSPNKCFDSGRNIFGAKPLASRDISPEYVLLFNGKCVKHNQPNENCRQDEIVSFNWPSELSAQCKAREIQLKSLSVGSTLKCSPGSYLTLFGRCQFPFDFD